MTRTACALGVAVALTGTLLAQVPQEKKPVPKDSVRVSISGCTKGYMFTVGPRIGDIVDGLNIPSGTHLRMSGPKKLITEIDAYRGSMVAITGLMKKGQFANNGVNLGPLHLVPAQPSTNGALGARSVPEPAQIDVEGWSPATGTCPE